ncbi:hypothetical protein I4U23_013003 [Adineta vaga]|nr:hypothetical protein I4U23_013003 [Adineta vaga]
MAATVDFNPRLVESIRDEPKRLLLPISGYENEPLLPIEEACKPLQPHIVKDLPIYITTAKMNSMEPVDELTSDESAAIQLYTMEWTNHDDSLYMILNRTLRASDRNELRPWFRYLKLFLTAFFKLPTSVHTVIWRGVREDLTALYPKDKQFAWWAFSSCSTSIDVLKMPNYLGTSGTRTIFSIQTTSAKLIRNHSYFQNEEEILLPPGIFLKVVGSLSSDDGLNIIHLQEVLPPHPMLADPFDLSKLKKTLPPATASSIPKKEDKPALISSPEKKDSQVVESAKSKYSNKKLDCNGHACAKCGNCRDWYWSSSGNGRKTFTKRANFRCTFCKYFYNDDYFFRGYWHTKDPQLAQRKLCTCDDNTS